MTWARSVDFLGATCEQRTAAYHNTQYADRLTMVENDDGSYRVARAAIMWGWMGVLATLLRITGMIFVKLSLNIE